MFEQAFKNIDAAIWKDTGCDSELDYAEQSSWILFLKWLDDFEKDEETKAKLDNKKYQSDRLVSVYKLATYYIETYDFTWEIETLSKVYYNDSSRLKNLRIIILNSLTSAFNFLPNIS